MAGVLQFEMGNVVEEDQTFHFVVVIVIAVVVIVGEITKISSVLDVDFKVTSILQLEIGTSHLNIWVQIPEENCGLKIKTSESSAK